MLWSKIFKNKPCFDRCFRFKQKSFKSGGAPVFVYGKVGRTEFSFQLPKHVCLSVPTLVPVASHSDLTWVDTTSTHTCSANHHRIRKFDNKSNQPKFSEKKAPCFFLSQKLCFCESTNYIKHAGLLGHNFCVDWNGINFVPWCFHRSKIVHRPNLL